MADFKFSIRPYRPLDKENLRALCCATGFFGKPIDRIFQDKKWFADLNTKYYLKFEPDSCFIAESEGQLIGYVLGCKRPLLYGKNLFSIAANLGFCDRLLLEELGGFKTGLKHCEDLEFYQRVKCVLKKRGLPWGVVNNAPIY